MPLRFQEYEHIGLFSRDESDDTESEDSGEDETTDYHDMVDVIINST